MKAAERRAPKLPGGFSLPPFGLHQWLALVIVAVALWALGLMWMGMRAGEQWTGAWHDELRFHVYLENMGKSNGANSRSAAARSKQAGKRLNELAQALAGLPGVAAVRIVPREEMRRWLRQWMGGGASGLDGAETNALLASLPGTVEVTPSGEADEFLYEDIRDLAARMGARANPGEARLAAARKWLENVGGLLWFVTLVAALAMAVVISNTLRMMLLSRADEVSLMRLLGAEEWFVRMPFVLEGMLLGSGAGLLGWALLWPVALGAADWLAALKVEVSVMPLLPPLVLGGALVGGLGAWLATLQMPERAG